MGKYGPGVTMKDAMQMDMAEVEAVLNRSCMDPDDRQLVTDTLKEAFYHWALTNAMGCAYEEYIKREGPELHQRACRDVFHSGAIEKKMADTYPADWCDE